LAPPHREGGEKTIEALILRSGPFGRVSKDKGGHSGLSWLETAQQRLLTMRGRSSTEGTFA
jgi:hypothetical protein